MQVGKLYQENKSCSKEHILLSAQNSNPNSFDDKITKFISWILLTICIGLCIIASIIYIVLSLNNESYPIVSDKGYYNSTILTLDLGDSLEKNNGNSNLSIQLSGKLTDRSLELYSKQGCFESFCHIHCFNNENLYVEISAVMRASYCKVFTSLKISDQYRCYFEASWIDVDFTVLKIELIKSQFLEIKSGAFSSPMFANVLHMTWIDLQLNEVSNGALLGLYSLNKLEIDFKLPNIGMTFLQPVQLTLTHLRLNCGISFQSSSNIFENIYLENLVHLDLSHNIFSGPLSKRIFDGTPNVTHLFLKDCLITAIEDTAFQDIANKLISVNLNHNLLTQISADVLGIGGSLQLLDLEPNNWNCNCELQSLIKFYNENKSIFVSAPYCRMPSNLYGKHFEELNGIELNCDPPLELPDTIFEPSNKTNRVIVDETVQEVPTNKSIYGAILQFSCSQAIAIDQILEEDSRKKRDVNIESIPNSGNFIFEPPIYDLNLELFQNYTARAMIDGYQLTDQLNIIWFTEEVDSDATIANLSHKDYNCMRYDEPYIITDILHENHTYTFCMMSVNDVVVSPLFCQPLYVPIINNESAEVNIDASEKQFTIAMLCLIFFISTIFGAIFAYLGIKSFPHLLEGSKNVVVIKKLDKTCCISTIAESHYGKTSFNKDHIHKSSLAIETRQPSEISTDPYSLQIPGSRSDRSSSTCFEECFSNIQVQTIEYEMPMPFTETSELTKNIDGPSSPPPLPKRNSKAFYVDQQPT